MTSPKPSTPLISQLNETTQFLQNQLTSHGFKAPIRGAIVLGSGLGRFVDTLKETASDAQHIEIAYSEIPHFAESTVEGHAGSLLFSELSSDFGLVCMQGRFHYYEGYSMDQVVYPIRTLKQLGANTLVVTNAAGGLNADFQPGDLMLIIDHLNLMGTNPLIGSNTDELGPRFPDMSEAYSQPLREQFKRIAQQESVRLVTGQYAGLTGPCYETPAEIRMLRTLGADAVGMSTVPEVIAANHMGMQVAGISCISNLAAGIAQHKLSHDEVVETGARVAEDFSRLLLTFFKQLAQTPSVTSPR